MGKKSMPRRLADNEAMAKHQGLRVSPQKLNLVAGLIRNKHVSDALNDLEFSHKRISSDVYKALLSAISNAENNHGLDIDNLFVKEAYVGKGMVMKRMRARARGRSAKILKPHSNLTIIVQEIKGVA